MAILVDWTDHWLVASHRPLRTLTPADPIGFSDPDYVASTGWSRLPGGFRDGPNVTLPATIGTQWGPVEVQSPIGWNGEAYYRAEVLAGDGPLEVRFHVDNWAWVWVDGLFLGSRFYGGSGGDTFAVPGGVSAGLHVVAIRSRSTGDTPNGAHTLVVQVHGEPFPAVGEGWTVGHLGVFPSPPPDHL